MNSKVLCPLRKAWVPVLAETEICRPSQCCGPRLSVAAPVSLRALSEMRFSWAAPGPASSVRHTVTHLGNNMDHNLIPKKL